MLAGGCITVALGTIDELNLPKNILKIIGLIVVTIGSGFIKPCSNRLTFLVFNFFYRKTKQ